MDWAALKSISLITKEEFCFYCKTRNPYCSHNHLKRTVDELGLLLGLGPSNIILCFLHLKENVVQYFLRIILNSNIMKEEEIIKLIKTIPTFNYFKINKELANNDKIKIYVTGKQCDNFFNNIHIFKNAIPKEDYILFIKFIEIINILNTTKPFTNDEIENIENLINNFSDLYIKKYSINTNKCWYLHLFNNHMISILKIYLNIKIFENQNFEAAHIDDEELLEKTSKNGGICRNYLKIYFPTLTNLKILQCLLIKLRILYSSIYFNITNLDICNHNITKDITLKKNYKRSVLYKFITEPYVKFNDDLILLSNLQNFNNSIIIDEHDCNKNIQLKLKSFYNPQSKQSGIAVKSRESIASTKNKNSQAFGCFSDTV
ncbi:hypothetical protein ABK040_004254 [Willaertia magna]